MRSAPFAVGTDPAPADDDDPIAAFERELGALVGGRLAVACAGREAALHLALRLATESHARDEVEVAIPTLDADGAARAALALGLRVLPIDVDQDSGNLSARALAASIGERTKAVVVGHLFGHPATMPDIVRLAEYHGLALVEDISCALGAAYADAPVGTSGAVTAIGGGPGHLVTPEDVGAVLISDADHAVQIRAWRDEVGGPPHSAAVRVALAELRESSSALHARRQAAWHLTYELRQVRGVSPMHHGRRIRHAYDCYVVRLRSVLWDRSIEETAAALTAEGVPATVAIQSLLHQDPDVIARLGEEDERVQPARFPAAQQLALELLSIPLTAQTTSLDMNDVSEAIRKVAEASQRAEGPR